MSIILQQPFPWWSPSRKGEDILKDYKLNPIENFPFVSIYHMSLDFPGQEFILFRPLIYGKEIHIPNITLYGVRDMNGNKFTIIKHRYGGAWIEEGKSFALHIEWCTLKIRGYDQHKPIYEAENHWVENCYFTVDPESGNWVPLSPTEQELEQVRRWAIVSELGG